MQELDKLYGMLSSFLGEAKNGFDGECMQLQFPCPKCIEKYGEREAEKHNLEVNLAKGKFHCWKCSAEDDHMSGSIYKLIRMYGPSGMLQDYKDIVSSIRDSELYSMKFGNDIFSLDEEGEDAMKLPEGFIPFRQEEKIPARVAEYIRNRGLDMRILLKHRMGYTMYDERDKTSSNRIILPSYGTGGELTYWTGRDYTGNSRRQKYFNPKAERKDIIFNESLIKWDADITIVEGPFDHIVVPNSIPLLGKCLKKDYRIYKRICERANARVNVFLDGDAYQTAVDTYKLLEFSNLEGRVRIIPAGKKDDPSSIFQRDGRRGIINALRSARRLEEREVI